MPTSTPVSAEQATLQAGVDSWENRRKWFILSFLTNVD